MIRILITSVLTFLSFVGFGQFPGCPDVDAGPDQTLACPGLSTTLTAQPIISGLTTTYTAGPIDYTPPIAYNAPGGTPISVSTDDVWSPNIQLPFNFCFYGQTYTTCRVGSNGAIKMGGGNNNTHPWSFNSSVPSNNLTNAGNIFGIYHDIDPSVSVPNGGGTVKWYLLGQAPCRIFVVSFYEMAHFSCNNLRSTHMMVLYETTNVIDVYVEKKETCSGWNGGRAVIGIQNNNGSQGVAAPNRNTGPWTVSTPEAWRFTPNGAPTYDVSWLQNGQVVSNSTNLNVSPNQTTTYTASVTYTPCAGGQPVTVVDDVTVFVNQGVTPTFAPINSSYCQGSQVPELPNNSQNGITGTWSPAINNQQTTVYTFTPNPNQCANSVQTTINITPLATPVFSFPDQYCVGANIPAFPTVSGNGVQGSWIPAPNNQQTTTYTFTPVPVSNGGQCAVPITKTVFILPFEEPDFPTFGPYCENDAIPELPTISTNGILGFWTPAINNQQTEEYTFTPAPLGNGSLACATNGISLTIQIIANEDPIFEPFPSYCYGSEIPALPTISLNEVEGTWTPAINNQQTTTYTFSSGSAGCFNPYSMTLEILPILESNVNIQRCQNNLPFFWNGLALTTSGNYSATFLGSNGCDSIAMINFQVVPILESTTIVTICEYDVPFIWNGLTLLNSGPYQVTLTSSTGCDSIVYLSLHVKNKPIVDFTSSALEGCGSVNTTLEIITPSSYVESLWIFGNGYTSNQLGNLNYTFNEPGCHSVTLQLTDQYGCTNTKEVTDMICVFPNPIASFEVNNDVLNGFNQTVDFINLSQNADTYTWHFGIPGKVSDQVNPSFTYPDVSDQYVIWLIAQNSFGCVDSTSKVISVDIEPVYYIPNAFTPDGDKLNNSFLPVFTSGFDPYNFKMLIFNRWGEVMFESNDARFGWDGSYGGKIMQDGVYIYQIEFRDLETDKRYKVNGHVTLVK